MEILGLVDIPTWAVWTLEIVGLLVVLCTVYTIYMCWDYGIFKTMGVDGPKPTLILGNFAAFREKGIIDAQDEFYKKYDKIWGNFDTYFPVLNIGKPELVKDISVKEFPKFVNRRKFINAEEPMDSILTVIRDDQWKHVRNYITPTFSGNKLRQMTDLINGAADRLIENMKPKVDKGEHIEIKETMGGYTMDVISSTAFGMEVDSQRDPNNPFVVQSKRLFDPNSFGFKYIMFLMFFAPFLIPVLKFLRLPHGFPRSVTAFFRKVTQEALADRRNNPSVNKDFIGLMVQAEKESSDVNKGDHTNRKGLTESEIVAQALLFFLAGYDTTASSLAYTMYMLSANPECMDKAISEVDEVLGDKHPTYETAKKLNYIEMCISESLRHYSVAPRVDRVASEDLVLGGIHIPKGMCVAIPISSIHKDPEYWPDPEKFDPERFTPEEKAKRDPYVYMPFGHGPRNCIGMRLALLESKIAIARMLQKFNVSKSEKTKEPVKPNKMGQLRIEDGLWVKMTNREA